MHSADLGRRIFCSPLRLWQIVCLLLFILQQVCDGTRELLHLLRSIEKIHFVVLLSHFIRETTCPSLDLVKFVLLLIVAGFTNVDLLVRGKVAWSTLVVSCKEHDETTINDLVYRMIAILPGLYHFILVEMLVESMHGLFRAIVPASIDPLPAILILPCSIDLRHDGFREIIRVLYVYPIAHFPQLAIV